MTSAVAQLHWSPPSSGDLTGYFTLPAQGLPTPPIFFVNIATPPASEIINTSKTATWRLKAEEGRANSPSSGISSAGTPQSIPVIPLSTPASPHGVDPPRPAREGYEWVWFPEGYWAERQPSRDLHKSASAAKFWKWKSRSNKSASDMDSREISYASPTSSMSVPQNMHEMASSPFLSESAHVLSLQQPSVAEESPLSTPRRGAYTPSAKLTDDGSVTTSTSTARRAARTLYAKVMHEIDKLHPAKRPKKHDDAAKKTSRHDSAGASYPENPESGLKHTGSWLKRELSNLGNSKKIFGRAPWRHKESLDSTSTVSSSVRDVLRGATPPTTPTNMKNQRKVDAQFPGGEAIRINTPPLDEDTADGRPRGFFTSTTPPGDGSRSQPSTPTARCPMPRYNIHRSGVVGQSREWWEQMPHLQRRHNSIIQGSPRFEFDIPEHLASSPLCPANAKHKNGGVGLCVYHGRRRATELLREEYLEALNRNGRELM